MISEILKTVKLLVQKCYRNRERLKCNGVLIIVKPKVL